MLWLGRSPKGRQQGVGALGIGVDKATRACYRAVGVVPSSKLHNRACRAVTQPRLCQRSIADIAPDRFGIWVIRL